MKSFLLTACCVVLISLPVLFPVYGEIPGDLGSQEKVEERKCLDCHRYPNVNTNAGVIASKDQCYECHADKQKSLKKITNGTQSTQVSLHVSEDSFETYPHKSVACIQCHPDVARSPHETIIGAQCTECHTVHGEKTANDPHLRVDCQACHHPSKFVDIDPKIHRIQLSHIGEAGIPIALTDHKLDDLSNKESCKKCHFTNNHVGAPAAVLPSKSVLCLVCHSAPLAISHPIFIVAALVLIIGIIVMFHFWFQGSVKGEENSIHQKVALTSESIWETIFSRKFWTVLKVIIFDIILQRRILKESVRRWSMHSLIYLGIIMRFALGIFTLAYFKADPESELAVALIDKNHGFTAFIYDLTGLFILTGIIWVIIQRFITRPAHVKTEITDNVTIAIVGILIVLGFILEGARISVTNIPAEIAAYSFIGFLISKMLDIPGLNLQGAYGWLWYAHAIMGAVFIAYFPYGKLKHIFNAPLTYLIEEVAGEKKNR